MNHIALIIIAITAAGCGSSPVDEARTAIEAQREICDGVAKFTPDRIAAVRSVDAELARGIERTQELCAKVADGLEKTGA